MARKLIGLWGFAMAVAAGCGDGAVREEERALTVDPASSGIEHVVVVMMENRSFDHFLGWLPRRRRQAGRPRVPRPRRRRRTDVPARPRLPGLRAPDPDHSYEGGAIEYNGGACDGWLRAGDERPVRDRLLHAEGPAVLRAGGAALDGLRPLLLRRSWPRRTRTASTSTRRRPTG